MKKNVLVALMAIICVAKSFAYDKVVFTNYTKNAVDVEVNYAGCKNDKFSVAPGATGSPSTSRGGCLITWISATGASNYTSSGTSYSRFCVIEINGKNEVHRVNADGTIADLPAGSVVPPSSGGASGGYPKVVFTNYTGKQVTVEVNYAACKKDVISVPSGATASPSANRGACLITSISATGATNYTSTGTSYSRFGVFELNGKLAVKRIDPNGKPID